MQEKIRECKTSKLFRFFSIGSSKSRKMEMKILSFGSIHVRDWRAVSVENVLKHEIPPKLNMYEMAEYRIEIDIQFIIIFRLLAM